MISATLCLLTRQNQGQRELLLAMKKRGFGRGKWNGVGGKFEPEIDKSILDTAIRETKEEIGVVPQALSKVAHLNFHYPDKSERDWVVHVFLVDAWQGEPKETEEMKPQWFSIADIPFSEMWPDDKFWLPHILKGNKVQAQFAFNKGDIIKHYSLKIVPQLA